MILLYFCSCSVPTERSSVELISFLQGGDLLTMRVVKSNTGISSGEGHIKTHFWKRTQSPMSLGLNSSSTDGLWQTENYQLGPNYITLEEQQWQAKIQSDEFNLRLQSNMTMTGCSGETDDWSANVLQLSGPSTGWLHAEKQSAPLIGQALLIEHSGNLVSAQEKKWLISQNTEVAFFYEDWLDLSFGCIEIFGERIILSDDLVQWNPQGATIAANDWTIKIQYSELLGVEDPYEHVTSIERWISTPFFPTQPIHWYNAVAEITGKRTLYLPVILRYQGDSPPVIVKRKKK